jgi:hypothetical protein
MQSLPYPNDLFIDFYGLIKKLKNSYKKSSGGHQAKRLRNETPLNAV